MLPRLNSLPLVREESDIAQVSDLKVIPDRSEDFGNELHYCLSLYLTKISAFKSSSLI